MLCNIAKLGKYQGKIFPPPPQIRLIVLCAGHVGSQSSKVNMISFKRNAQVWQNHHYEYKRTPLLQMGLEHTPRKFLKSMNIQTFLTLLLRFKFFWVLKNYFAPSNFPALSTTRYL